ncbi:MAG: hypothetical protein ACYTX0_50985, partial [Nostoc sp.]
LFLGCANDNATSTLLYETLHVACFSCAVRQAQGIALGVACNSCGVRQSSGQRVAQYPSLRDAARSLLPRSGTASSGHRATRS